MPIPFHRLRVAKVPLMALALAACGPSPPPAKAPAPAAPKATSVVVCGERISTTTDEVRCVGEGVVALEGLRELDRLTKLTLDDQSLPALWNLDDTTLARLRELTIESVPVFDTTSFILMGTPLVKTDGFARLGGLVSLELRVDLEDPKTLRSLTNLRVLKTSTSNLPDAEVVSEMVALEELHVGGMSDLRPLRKLRSLELLGGVEGQRSAFVGLRRCRTPFGLCRGTHECLGLSGWAIAGRGSGWRCRGSERRCDDPRRRARDRRHARCVRHVA